MSVRRPGLRRLRLRLRRGCKPPRRLWIPAITISLRMRITAFSGVLNHDFPVIPLFALLCIHNRFTGRDEPLRAVNVGRETYLPSTPLLIAEAVDLNADGVRVPPLLYAPTVCASANAIFTASTTSSFGTSVVVFVRRSRSSAFP